MVERRAGGIESSGRGQRRFSEPNPNAREDQIQQPSTQAEASTADAEDLTTFAQNDSPRGHLTVFRPVTSTHGSANGTLSRNTSSGSNSSERSRRSRGHHERKRLKQQGIHDRSSQQASSSRPLEPPVTKATLSELDVNKIVHNPKLRHDINFDPELHFRPNLDGEKGRRKQERADHFWRLLEEQLQQFVANPVDFFERHGQGPDWCLPLLLKSIKEIIETLVPSNDRVYLDEGLNVELIMQQFYRGIADLEKLAAWLSGVLKSHCAPMRDEWVDEMYNQLTNGNRNNKMEELVRGMRSLLSVLEAMKLDVANHQIRCLRPILIEDTVRFEKKFFAKKIQSHRLEPHTAQEWYQMAARRYQPGHASKAAFGDMAVFFEALSSFILPSNLEHQFPNTFLFDEERLMKLRSDMLDAINLEVCMRMHEKLEKKYRSSGIQSIPSPYLAARFADSSGYLSAGSDDDSDYAKTPSRPASLVFSSSGSANSSPRSSMIIPTPSSHPVDGRVKSRSLYNSLVALLQNASTTSRPLHKWKMMKDSLALEIFRFTYAPQNVLPQFEDELEQHLSQPNSTLFQEVEHQLHTRLMDELCQRVKEFRQLTGVGLFSVATGARVQGSARNGEGPRDRTLERSSLAASLRESREEGGIEDMAIRLAHLGILHWRVWAELVYQPEWHDTDVVMSMA